MHFFRLFWRAGLYWNERDAGTLAAALAYFTPFALVPLIVISIMIASFFVGQEVFTATLLAWGQAVSPDLTQLIVTGLDNFSEQDTYYSIPVIGLLFFAWMIIYTFNNLVNGLHRLWQASYRGWKNFINISLRSLLFFILLQCYMIFLIVVNTILQGSELLRDSRWIIEPPIIFVATVILFYFSFKVLSRWSPSRMARLVGALVVATAFIFMQVIVSYWIATTPAIDIFGAAGIVIGLLIWVYLIAAVIYYGAAVAWVFDHERIRR